MRTTVVSTASALRRGNLQPRVRDALCACRPRFCRERPPWRSGPNGTPRRAFPTGQLQNASRTLRPQADRFRRPRIVIGVMSFALAAFVFSTNSALCQDAEVQKGDQDAVAKQKPTGGTGSTQKAASPFQNTKRTPATKSSEERWGPTWAETVASPQPSLTAMSLEDMLAAALKDNPEIRVAEAKVREAEAELNRVRLDVAQKVMSFRDTWEAQKAKIDECVVTANETEQLFRNKAIQQVELRLAQSNVAVSRAVLKKLESELPYLLGRGPQGASVSAGPQTTATRVFRLTHANAGEVRDILVTSFGKDRPGSVSVDVPTNSVIFTGAPETLGLADAIVKLADRSDRQPADGTKPRSEMEQKILKALNTPIKASFDEVPLDKILKSFRETFGIPFVVDPSSFRGVGSREAPPVTVTLTYTKVTLDLGEVPLAIALQAIQDLYHVSFGVRDYGIFVSSESGGRAWYGGGEGRSGAVEFWRSETRKANP